MKATAASLSGVKLKTPWLIEFIRWNRPFGPCGFIAWSVTLAISGKSRLASHRMLCALLVHEICSAYHALLLLTSVHDRQSSRQQSLKNLRAKSIAAAVSDESIDTVLPSCSTSCPP